MEDIFIIEDLDTLRAIADSRRLTILNLLNKPQTPSQVAAQLGERSNTIYYHISELEKRGLVRLVETRMKGHLVEKVYQASAKLYTPARALLESCFDLIIETGLQYMLTLIDGAGIEINRALAAGMFQAEKLDEIYYVQTQLSLRPDQLQALSERIQNVIDEFEAEQDPQAENQSLLTVLLHPKVTNQNDIAETGTP
jgi:DNA-binding transcriptional ArsR family regulator